MGTFQNRYNPRSAVEAALNAVRGLGDNSNYSEGGANGADMLSPAPSAVQPEANVAVEPNEAVAPVGPAVSWPSDMARAEAKRAGMTWEQAPGTTSDTPNPYLADWGHYSLGDVVYGRRGEDGAMDESMRRADVPVHQLLSDYANYEQSQGRTPDYVSMMQVLQAGDPRLSSAEQQKEEKRQRRRERWEQLTNLLSHLGNFYGTTQGAPSAPLESGPALSQRQQRLRDVTRQFRQQLSNQYLQAYARRAQEQRAADIAKAREQDRQQLWQWRKQQEERLAGKQALDSAKLDWKKQYDEGRLDIAREQNRIRDMVAKGQISHYEAQDALNKLQAFATKTTTTEETDPLTGEKKTKTATVTTTPAGNTPSKTYQPKKNLTYNPKK